MRFEISTTATSVFVEGRREPQLDAIPGAKWHHKDSYYAFPLATEQAVRAAVARIEALYATPPTPPTTTTPTPAPTGDAPTGWSKAARRRAGTTTRSHPLADGVLYAGDGFTEYEDGIRGGRVQIWDES